VLPSGNAISAAHAGPNSELIGTVCKRGDDGGRTGRSRCLRQRQNEL
jgi:hypothetical protein